MRNDDVDEREAGKKAVDNRVVSKWKRVCSLD